MRYAFDNNIKQPGVVGYAIVSHGLGSTVTVKRLLADKSLHLNFMTVPTASSIHFNTFHVFVEMLSVFIISGVPKGAEDRSPLAKGARRVHRPKIKS